jgi:hypothetical protein
MIGGGLSAFWATLTSARDKIDPLSLTAAQLYHPESRRAITVPILKVPSGVTVMRPFVVAGKIIPGLDSLIQKSVGVGFPEAMQSREAGAPSATFWSVGSTKNIGGE